jgi:ribosomal protein S18 acetylase RimI-like enzyme
VTRRDHRIRQAEPDDAGFLTDVVVVATRAQGRWPADVDEATFRRDYEAGTRSQLLDGPPASTISVIELGGVPVGRLRVVRDAQCIELAGIQLHPSVQGRGIGTAIIEDLAAEAVEAGADLVLSVEHDNPRARALYERLGFVYVGEDTKEARLRWQPAHPSV